MLSVLAKVYLLRPPDASGRLTAPLALGTVDDVKDGHAVADFVNVVIDKVGVGQAADVGGTAWHLGEHARHEGDVVVNYPLDVSDGFSGNPRHPAIVNQIVGSGE